MLKRKHDFSWREWFLIAVIALMTLAIVVAIAAKVNDKPVERAEQELRRIADDYYLTYLYPRLLGNLKNNPAEMLSQYDDEMGVSPIYLRQLLHYDATQSEKSSAIFARIGCNTNLTGVHYFPVAPYGPHDYRVEYLWDCQQKP